MFEWTFESLRVFFVLPGAWS